MFTAIISLALTVYGLYTRVGRLDRAVYAEAGQTGREVILNDTDIDLEEMVTKEVARQISVLPTSAPSTTTVVEKTTEVSAPSATKSVSTSFIPLNGTKVITNTQWETIEDSAVWIDLLNDYGSGAVVTWSTSLKVAHGNGQAYARIWDDTNKIAVDGSEISTKNNVNYETVVSGNLPLWKGKNLYKVQVKSLNGFEVTYSGGKMKVSN